MKQNLKPNRSDNWGGSRENAGRPKGIETTTIRIPLFLKPIIERYVKRKRTEEELKKEK